MRIFLLKYSGLLLIGLLIEYWIFWYAPIDLPEYIPLTPIRTEGLFLLGLMITILIVALKYFFKTHPEATIFRLTASGSIICFMAETVFQAIRQLFIIEAAFNDRLYYFLIGTAGVSFLGAVLSFFISFQIKTKNTGQLVLFITGFVIAFNMAQYLFHLWIK